MGLSNPHLELADTSRAGTKLQAESISSAQSSYSLVVTAVSTSSLLFFLFCLTYFFASGLQVVVYLVVYVVDTMVDTMVTGNSTTLMTKVRIVFEQLGNLDYFFGTEVKSLPTPVSLT